MAEIIRNSGKECDVKMLSDEEKQKIFDGRGEGMNDSKDDKIKSFPCGFYYRINKSSNK